MRSPLLTVVVVALMPGLLVAGCLDQGTETTYRLAGTLSEDADDNDTADLRQRAEAYGAELYLLESFPLQYDIQPLSETGCQDLAEELEGLDYVTEVRSCQVMEATEDGSQPTSSG